MRSIQRLTSSRRWNKRQASGGAEADQQSIIDNVDGFASISRRYSTCKPIIAAVNGGAYGGGVETILNCDLVVASENAKFALPEVKRGVVAVQGGGPALCAPMHAFADDLHQACRGCHGRPDISLRARCCSLARPSLQKMLRRDLACKYHVSIVSAALTPPRSVNKVVPQGEVLSTALAWAAEINANSPDAVQSTKRALLLASRNGSIEDAVIAHMGSKESKRAFTSENIQVRWYT